MPVKVSVTPEDIATGQRRRASRCPVAVALRRATDQDWWVGNDDRNGTVLDPCVGREIEAPKDVHWFRLRFDRGLRVKPFTFEIPDEYDLRRSALGSLS